MIGLIKYCFYFLTIGCFGYISLSQIARFKSLILLIILSFPFGLSAYIFTCHILSFFLGIQRASIISFFFILVFIPLILFFCKKPLTKIENELNKIQLLILISIALIICTLSYFAINRTGPIDSGFHLPIALTMFHNDLYPPRDPFRSEYVLLYHYGGDLLACAIHKICNLDMSRAFELILSTLTGITFLSFFALAWIVTKNFNTSLIAAFCTYFSGGFLWLDTIFRFLTKNLPPSAQNYSFIQTFFSFGIHSSIINAPSVCLLIPTVSLGYPILIFSLILAFKLIEERDLNLSLIYFFILNISLSTLFLSAEWLYATFWAGLIPFVFFTMLKQKKWSVMLTLFLLLCTSICLTKITNGIYFEQESVQNIGRANILNISLKDNPLWIISWSRLTDNILNYQKVFLFSWDFISEFGLSFFLFPLAIAYLIKNKNSFVLLLFLCAITTMPLPLFLDFKTNSVDLNRIFNFGNSMIVLLITCCVIHFLKIIPFKKWILTTYIIFICLSPFIGLISSSIFSSYITFDKAFINFSFNEAKTLKEFNKALIKLKNLTYIEYKEETSFLETKSKPTDVAISCFHDLPLYTGIYTLIPSNYRLYKDQLFSSFDNIYPTIFQKLDPYIIDELNVKWIIINDDFKRKLSKEVLDRLNNKDLYELEFKSSQNKTPFYIYHAKNLKPLLKNYNRKTGWILVNGAGQSIETYYLQKDTLKLFSSLNKTLIHLKELQNTYPSLKKELITAQPIVIQELEKQISDNMLNFSLEKLF